jgi:hypothetical protein
MGKCAVISSPYVLIFPSHWNYKTTAAETESRIHTYIGVLDVLQLAKHEMTIVVAFDQNILCEQATMEY